MRIVIHNFGPIKEADIETKRYTVFIGQTSTGKSVAAKLISIANDADFFMLEEGDFKGFASFLAQYSIDFPFYGDTEIVFFRDKATWTIRKDVFHIEGEMDPFWENVRTLEITKHDLYKEQFEEAIKNIDYSEPKRIFFDSITSMLSNGKGLDWNSLSDFQKKMMYLTT